MEILGRKLKELYSLIHKGRDKGANVNAKNNDGATPLHWAALHDNLQVAGLFINKRANVNAKDENGWTPLHTAAARGNLGVVKLILDKSDYV
ncbi:ankyrin repeat domain-containing protein, partial [Wolbachia endosymbiont of Bemisia tabaci]|uniref:ankyrin repeat domain-containing protein n=1 Tax=Wolbachia endosymbiont of Bemisia tabaci TaxID=215173 RepID=UPI0015D05772